MIRLPWGTFSEITSRYVEGQRFDVVGCLSFEERSLRVPMLTSHARGHVTTIMVRVSAARDAFPDYSDELNRRMDNNEKQLGALAAFKRLDAPLLIEEDELIDLATAIAGSLASETVILDITCFPKRFFCLLLKQLLRLASIRDLIVTYTQAGPGGYTRGHLSLDPGTSDHLPGFAPMVGDADTLVIAVGFEPLSLATVVELYGRQQRPKLLFSFPANGTSFRRQWRTAGLIFNDDVTVFTPDHVAVVAAWDAELVMEQLAQWHADSSGLILAPFGAKPHTLGMALFAIQESSGLYYTQPKAYSPDYSTGFAETWAYVVKRRGVPCVANRG